MMIKISTLLLSLTLISGEISAGKTIVGQEFYGTWSTISSLLRPNRQILELDSSGGRWISIYDDGEERVSILKASNISIQEDLLIVDYINQKKDYRLKLVLAGWKTQKNKKIFGTIYHYSDFGEGLRLINGIPISFENGSENMPPKKFWEFFTGPEVEKVNSGYIIKLEKGLKEINDVKIIENEGSTGYILENLKYMISITKKGEPNYPSAIGVKPSSNHQAPLVTSGKYEGDDAEFKSYYKSFLNEIDTVNHVTQEKLRKLFQKIKD